MSTNLEDDLRARWRPSPEQVEQAEAFLRDDSRLSFDSVYTAHLLANKTFGFWTPDVVVIPLPGLFHSRNAASEAAEAAARARYAETGKPVTSGYARHEAVYGDDGVEIVWAVWEDILASFPERQASFPAQAPNIFARNTTGKD